MSPCTIRSPKSSSIRVTSQPRPVASGQLIRTSLSVSLSPPYTSLQEACYYITAMNELMCWQLQSVVVVLADMMRQHVQRLTATLASCLKSCLLEMHRVICKLVCTLAGAPRMRSMGSDMAQCTLYSVTVCTSPDGDDFFLSFHKVLTYAKFLLATAARAC